MAVDCIELLEKQRDKLIDKLENQRIAYEDWHKN